MQFTSLWDDASHDAEQDISLRLLVTARQAAVPTWSFLANAKDLTDFDMRLEYAEDRLLQAARVATRENPEALGSVYAALLESLREDFQIFAKDKGKDWVKPWEDGDNDDDDAEGKKESDSDEDENDSEDENTDDDDNDDDDAKGKSDNKDDKKGKNPFGKKATYPGHNNHSGDAYERPFNWDNYHKDMNDYGSAVGPSTRNDDGVDADWDEYSHHQQTCPTCGSHTGSRHPLVTRADHQEVSPEPLAKTSAWIVINEKSHRRAAGPFPSKPQALEVLNTRFKGKPGFSVEQQAEEGREATLQSDRYSRFGPDWHPGDENVNWPRFHREQDEHNAIHNQPKASDDEEPRTCPKCGGHY